MGQKVAGLRAVIVDRDRLFREGLERLLRSSKFMVTGSAQRIGDLLDLVSGPERPHMIVCGLDPGTDTEEQLMQFCYARKDASLPRIVALTRFPEKDLLSRAATAGFDAVLSKDISTEVLQRSLELVMLGQQVFPAVAQTSILNGSSTLAMPALLQIQVGQVVTAPTSPGPIASAAQATVDSASSMKLRLTGPGQARPLSDREDQILRQLVAGASNKVIARSLGITEGTVKVHVKSLLRKLGATNRTQAAIWGNHFMALPEEDILRPDPGSVSG